MADLGYIEGLIKALPTAEQSTLLQIFRALVNDIRFGHPIGDQPDPMLNMAGGFFHGTTSGTPGMEFSIAHGFGRVPYLAIPILRLDAIGEQVVPLTVSRAADDKRIYFTSTVANAAISLAVEG